MSTRIRKARKRAGLPLVKAAKVPTPPLERSHTWRTDDRGRLRPTRIGVVRYGIRDLGWAAASKYITKRRALTKAAQA